MATVGVTLAVPPGDGVGAPSAVANMGAAKTIIVGGVFKANVIVEAAAVAGGGFCEIASFSQPGKKVLNVLASELRVRIQGFVSGAPSVDVSAQAAAVRSAALPVTAGDGVGASVPISVLNELTTAVVGGSFTGQVIVEVSDDNVDFAQGFKTVTRPSCETKIIPANFARARRTGTSSSAPGTPVVGLASAEDVGGVSAELGLNNILDFGAVSGQDSTSAIQAALDDAALTTNNKGGILIPAGNFLITRVPAVLASIDINGLTDLLILGRGDQSILAMSGDGGGGDWAAFRLRGSSSGIKFQDFAIDGNKAGITNPDPQTHLIQVQDGSNDVEIVGLLLHDAFGDGVRLLGEVGLEVEDVTIERNRFVDNGRSAIAVQRATRNSSILNNRFSGTSDQDIDFEPTGVGAVDGFLIADNDIIHSNATFSVTLGGTGTATPATNVRFTTNRIEAGKLQLLNLAETVIALNCISGHGLNGAEVITGRRVVDDVKIIGNDLVQPIGGGPVVALNQSGGFAPRRCLVQGNRLRQEATGQLLQLEGSDDIIVDSNHMVYAGSGAPAAVSCRALVFDMNHLVFTNNEILGSEGTGGIFAAINFSGNPNDFGFITVAGNMVKDCNRGVDFSVAGGGVFNEFPMVQGNSWDTTSTDIGGLATVVAVCIDGNVGTVTPLMLMGDGDPAVTGIVAPVGSQFVRRDGGVGTSLYVNETGLAAGWAAK